MTGHFTMQCVPAAFWSHHLFSMLGDAVINPTAVGCPPEDAASREQLALCALEAVKAVVASSHLPSLVAYLVQQIGSGK